VTKNTFIERNLYNPESETTPTAVIDIELSKEEHTQEKKSDE